MRVICELNDKIILGQDGLSDKVPRLTARAIVQNQDGLYAVMYSDTRKPTITVLKSMHMSCSDRYHRFLKT